MSVFKIKSKTIVVIKNIFISKKVSIQTGPVSINVVKVMRDHNLYHVLLIPFTEDDLSKLAQFELKLFLNKNVFYHNNCVTFYLEVSALLDVQIPAV